MPKTILLHSFYHGVGRSNIAANLAYLLAKQSKRVGLIDADTKAPMLHNLFRLDDEAISYSFNDYLLGACEIDKATYHVTPYLTPRPPGKIVLTPGNTPEGQFPRELGLVQDAELLSNGCQSLTSIFNLDALLIDTHAGISEKALVSVTVADILVIILRLNPGDYQGTGVTVDIVRRLHVPRVVLIANEAPSSFDYDMVKFELEKIYNCEVIAILPHLDEVMALANQDIFALRYPNHPITNVLDKAAKSLLI